MKFIQRVVFLVSASIVLAASSQAAATIFPVPAEIRSNHFTVTIDGQPAPVTHAASSYYFVNFGLTDSAEISVTAPTADYWAKGVEVQPWRLGIRPSLKGRTITFTISKPEKLSITRPGDHMAGADMLFVFANSPEVNPSKTGAPGLRYYAPGVYHENIDVQNNETVYLAPGAVVFGSLNVWGVKNVKILGRGTVIYDGPQTPTSDEGWMHRRNWHVIVMDHARNIEVNGITCIVRSRTWMIQMLESHHVLFENVKVIGGDPGNANQDGMDWLGGGDTLVRDCFIRSSDDIFALYGNWLGYTEKELRTPGPPVRNIVIENSVLSTSISNVVRVSWPKKVFNSSNFTLRDSDVIHMGSGGCGIPFALFEIWADPDGKGKHSHYLFQNIHLDDWYSLVQLRQPNPEIRDVKFKNIWALETPSLVPSSLSGKVKGVTFQNVKIADRVASKNEDIPLQVMSGANPPNYLHPAAQLNAKFIFTGGAITPGKIVTFDASPSSGRIVSYNWSFGDGTTAAGPIVRHAFPDAEGTLWDGSGRFRVLLKVTDSHGNSDWSHQPVVVASSFHDPIQAGNLLPGLKYRYFEGMKLVGAGIATAVNFSPRKRAMDYGLSFDGYLDIPNDGGYTFLLTSNDHGRLEIDGKVIATAPAPLPQVCGSIGNIVQPAMGSIGLKAGKHKLSIIETHTTGPDGFTLQWQGPQIPLSAIPPVRLFHR